MGVYDTIKSDYPLPDPEYQDVEFQTKDLNRTLDRYRITADGRLRRLLRRIDLFAKDTHSLDAAGKEEDMNYHGELCFYTDTDKGWLEYRARFTHGNLEWILRPGEAEPVSADSLERLARDTRYLEQERATRLGELLTRFEQLDPEVAQRAIYVFDDRHDAALWLISVHPALGKLPPYEQLARGKRDVLLDALFKLEHGICS